jgi:Fe-S-cluster containining protein
MTTEVIPADIKRLAKHMGISAKEFETKYCEDGEFGKKQIKSVPCMFLGEDNRCTVYEIRPKVCKEYPFLYKKGFLQRTMGVIGNAEVCPIVFNVWENLKDIFWPRRRR